MAFWDAHYCLQIILSHGSIDLTYTPPFFGVTPIINARHREEVRITFDLNYKPLSG